MLATGAPASGFAAAAAGALVPVLIAALSARLFRRLGLAIATGAVAAFVLGVGETPAESISLVGLLASAFLLVVAADRPSSNFAVLAGASLALAALLGSSALSFVPFLAAPLFDRRYPRRVGAHVAASAFLGFVFTFGAALLARSGGSGPSLRFEPGPKPWPYGVAAAAILCPFAAVGFARAERRGCAVFSLGVLAATLLVPAALGASRGPWAVSGDPIVLLCLYGIFGALSLTPRLREPAAEAG